MISFEIYHHEPSPLALAQTFCKENLSQLNNEIKPLELEIIRLKQYHDELKSQIMASRIIERENDLKTEFLLSRRDFPNDKVIDEKPYENIQENEIFDSNLWESEPIFIEIEEKGYMKKAFEKKKIAKKFEKSNKINEIILEKSEKSPEKQINLKKEERISRQNDTHFNKENIDKLTEEIEELLNFQRTEKKQFGNLSEIKEVSIEESFF